MEAAPIHEENLSLPEQRPVHSESGTGPARSKASHPRKQWENLHPSPLAPVSGGPDWGPTQLEVERLPGLLTLPWNMETSPSASVTQ